MYIFSILAILLNLFHIFVLSRRMMTSSAVTSLLIGIAVVDILSPVYYVKIGVKDLIFPGPWYDNELIDFKSYTYVQYPTTRLL